MSKRKTNVQFVKSIMEFSQHGALAQMFVIEAITKYAKACAEAKPEDMDSGFISGAAWQAVAKEIQGKIAEQYK